MSPVKAEIMTFSEKIKLICESEGINLKKFSDLAGISYGVIKSYSSGRREPTTAQIHRMTEAAPLSKYKKLLLSLDEPIGEDPEMMELIRQCEELGIADEAADVIRALLKHARRD